MSSIIIGTITNGVTLSSSGAYTSPLTIASNGYVTNVGNPGVDGPFGTAWTLVNSGTIKKVDTVGVYFQDGGSVDNNGTIDVYYEAIKITNAAGTVTNTGTIEITLLGSDPAVYLGFGGSLGNSGLIKVMSEYASGVEFGVNGTATLTNSGTILGGTASPAAGVDLEAGGSVDNSGTASLIKAYSDGIKINSGAGSVTNAGTIVGAIAVLLSDTGTVTNSGTIEGTGPAGIGVKLSFGGSIGNIGTGSQITGLTSGIYIGASLGTVTNAGTIMAGTAGVGVRFTSGGGGSIDNMGTAALIEGGSAVYCLVTADTVTNTGTIEGTGTSGFGVKLGGGGYLYNGGSILQIAANGIAVFLTSTASLVNAGIIDATGSAGVGVAISGSGSLANNGTIEAAGSPNEVGVTVGSATGSVINSGTILATFGKGVGVAFGNGGSIDNSGAASLIKAYSDGIKISNAVGTVTNAGTIEETNRLGSGVELDAGGSVFNSGLLDALGPHAVGVSIGGGTGYLSNSGSVEATTTNGIGVVFGDGGSVDNSGTASLIKAYSDGVEITNAAGMVTNSGIIAGTGSSSVGVSLSNGGTVIDSGTISGAGGTAVYFGGTGTSRLVIAPDAVLSGKATFNTGANATLELTGTNSGSLSGLGSNFVGFDALKIDSGAHWTLTGSNTLTAGQSVSNAGSLTLLNTSLNDPSALLNNGAITLDPSTLTAAAGLTGAGLVTIDGGGTLEINGTLASGETIAFNGSGGYLHLVTPGTVGGSVVNFNAGDTIDLAGVTSSSVSYSAGTLSFDGGSFSLSLAGGATLLASDSADGAAVGLLCFCRDTMILTPPGERRVQDLTVGDLVTTASGEQRPIVWIGTGKAIVPRGRRSAATPVVVCKGALADNVPNRDLHVTKGHSLFIDGVLIPVEFLVNHRSIQWDDWAQEVTIYHIEMSTHDVLIANGAPAESYRDDGNRWLFQNSNAGWFLPPQPPCAPVLTGGVVVDAAWRRLLDRTGPRKGLPLTDNPDLHLLVDGRRIDAIERRDDMYVFHLRAKPRSARIVSNAAVPQELGIARDARSLGVALRRIVLTQSKLQCAIEADDASLGDGYHSFEAENGIRWTTGNAAIPQRLLARMTGAGMLMLHLGGVTQYIDTGDAIRVA